MQLPTSFFRYASLLAFCLVLAISSAARSETFSATSPNGRVTLSVTLEQGRASYCVGYDDKVALSDSALGLKFLEREPLEDAILTGLDRRSAVRSREDRCGRQSQHTTHYNELALDLSARSDVRRRLTLIFRVYDEGVAFRYAIPEDSSFVDSDGYFYIESEETEFSFEHDYEAYMAFMPGYNTNQEGLYKRARLSSAERLFRYTSSRRFGNRFRRGDNGIRFTRLVRREFLRFFVSRAHAHDASYASGRRTLRGRSPRSGRLALARDHSCRERGRIDQP